MKTPPYDKGPRLMSIIDTAVFDFLIGKITDSQTQQTDKQEPDE